MAKKFHDIKKAEPEDFSDRFDETEPEKKEPTGHELFWQGVDFSKKEKKINRKKVFSFSPRFKQASLKAFAIIIVLGLLFVFSLSRALASKKRIDVLTSETSQNLSEAIEAINNGDLNTATGKADLAVKSIYETKLLVQSWGQDIKYLSMISDKKSKLVNEERLLNAADLILQSVSGIRSDLGSSLKNNIILSQSGEGSFSLDVAKNSEVLSKIVKDAEAKLKASKDLLEQIDAGYFPEEKNNIESARTAISGIEDSFAGMNNLFNKDLPWLCGSDGSEKNILIVFQNNGELRGGSGGSLGSFGVIKFKDGKMTGIDFGQNIYKLDHAFTAKTTVTPPDEIKFVNPNWTLKDSGWAVDGEESMQKIAWFYQQESNQKVDGVMVMDASLFVNLLKWTGPIEMPEYKKTITADNFISETEFETHIGYFESDANLAENEPKKILADMMPKFLSKVFAGLKDTNGALDFLQIMQKGAAGKDFMMWADNSQFEQDLLNFNYSGKVYPVPYDYLYVNNSNLNGGKTSRMIAENLNLTADITNPVLEKNSLTIERLHSGTTNDGPNNNFVRVLLSNNVNVTKFTPIAGNFQQNMVSGFKDGNPYSVRTEADRPEVNFWMSTNPGEKSSASIEYTRTTNFSSDGDFTYEILFQKQPGAPVDKVNFKLVFPGNYIPQVSTGYNGTNPEVNLNFDLDKDKYIRINFKKI